MAIHKFFTFMTATAVALALAACGSKPDVSPVVTDETPPPVAATSASPTPEWQPPAPVAYTDVQQERITDLNDKAGTFVVSVIPLVNSVMSIASSGCAGQGVCAVSLSGITGGSVLTPTEKESMSSAVRNEFATRLDFDDTGFWIVMARLDEDSAVKVSARLDVRGTVSPVERESLLKALSGGSLLVSPDMMVVTSLYTETAWNCCSAEVSTMARTLDLQWDTYGNVTQATGSDEWLDLSDTANQTYALYHGKDGSDYPKTGAVTANALEVQTNSDWEQNLSSVYGPTSTMSKAMDHLKGLVSTFAKDTYDNIPR